MHFIFTNPIVRVRVYIYIYIYIYICVCVYGCVSPDWDAIRNLMHARALLLNLAVT